MTLPRMVAIGATLEQAQQMESRGVISARTFRRYLALWGWSACRHGNGFGAKHDRFYARHGSAAYWRRIEANKALVAAIARRAA